MANTAATFNGGMECMEQGDRRSIHRRGGYHTPVGGMKERYIDARMENGNGTRQNNDED
jgi:hypothetical protein